MPARAAYALAAIAGDVARVVSETNQAQVGLLLGVGATEVTPAQWRVPDDARAEYEASVERLLAEDVEVQPLRVSLAWFGTTKIAIADMRALMAWIDVEG